MNGTRWQDEIFSSGEQIKPWELFHDNSKLGRSSRTTSAGEVYEYLTNSYESLPFYGFPAFALPRRMPGLKIRLDDAILSRISIRSMTPCSVKLAYLSALLYYGYGVSRSSNMSGFDRPSRVVPSAGALYPLEIFFHSSRVEDLPAGLYHYNPERHGLRLIREGDQHEEIAQYLVQASIARNASLLIFITGIFERTVFKYGDRGYRFAMLEAGHVAQNMNLVASALQLGCLNIGGFFDREIDAFLHLDGIAHSTIYMLAMGRSRHDYNGTRKKARD